MVLEELGLTYKTIYPDFAKSKKLNLYTKMGSTC
jgi:hypothetical protein